MLRLLAVFPSVFDAPVGPVVVQGLLDKHGRQNDKTPKGWKDGYHDLTPKSVKAAKAAGGGAEGENGAAAAAAPAAEGGEGEEAADGDAGEKKKKKKKDKVCEREGWRLLFLCVRACVCLCAFS